MNRINCGLFGLVLIALAVLGFRFGGRVFTRVMAQSSAHTLPYAVRYEDYFVQNGQKIANSNVTFSQSSDGSVSSVDTMYSRSGATEFALRTIELPTGSYVRVADGVRAKSTFHFTDTQLARRHAVLFDRKAGDCASGKDVVDGADTILNHIAYRFVTVAKDGLSRRTTWRFPDFNCQEYQITREQRLNAVDQWTLESGTDLLAASQSEPDANLFVVPSGYTEVKPSDMKRAVWASKGMTKANCPICFTDEPALDSNYAQMNE